MADILVIPVELSIAWNDGKDRAAAGAIFVNVRAMKEEKQTVAGDPS